MADIIVRIPTDQLEHFYDDKLSADASFWRFNGRPKRLEVGDFIWFTRPEGVKAGAKVMEITDRAIDSDDRSGKWNVLFDSFDTRVFTPPIAEINYAGQGFRYLRPEEQKRLRRSYKRS